MTRLVSLFFAGIAFILVVYWVVPGANPPDMTAVTPLVPTTTVHVADPVAAPAPAVPAVPVAAVPALSPALAPTIAPAAPPQAVARHESDCDADPIKCLLEGGHPTDPADVTGTIAPLHKSPVHAAPKPSANPAAKPVAKPH